MANRVDPVPEDAVQEFEEWMSTRPESVRAIGARLKPWKLYLLKTTGQRVYPIAYSEDGTVRVAIEQHYNPDHLFIVPFEVFGIDANDLEECDIPPVKWDARVIEYSKEEGG